MAYQVVRGGDVAGLLGALCADLAEGGALGEGPRLRLGFGLFHTWSNVDEFGVEASQPRLSASKIEGQVLNPSGRDQPWRR